MPTVNYLTNLLGIQNVKVVGIERTIEKERSAVIVDLERTNKEYVCGKCGQVLNNGYDEKIQTVQHLGFWHHLTFLRFKKYRVNCPDCGLTTEAINFVEPKARITNYLAEQVYQLCKVMTNKAVGLFESLNHKTVKNVDKRMMKKVQENRSLEGITALGVDEIFVGKTVWHMVSSLESPRGVELIYIGKGRKEKDLKGFWKWFGKERAKNISVAVMDMWKGFIKSFRNHCPDAKIIYDKFHVIMHLLEALNTVRKEVLGKANKPFKKQLTGKKFILLSRRANVRGKAREALNLLLGNSKRLLKAHYLKEIFGHLWSYKSKTWANKFWQSWKNSLKWSRLKSYQRFARMIDKHLDGILAYCDHKVPMGFIEAANLKAKNIIRRAYGYRDKGYMKLKIIQACSPPLGVFQPWLLGEYLTFTNGS